MNEPEVDRDEVLVVEGVPVGRYRLRDRPVTAEFFESLVDVADAADAIVTAMKGWSVTSNDDALITEILARGAAVSRRYTFMTLPLQGAADVGTERKFALEAVPLTPTTPVTVGIIDLIRGAYPPGHPDEEVGTDEDIKRDVGSVLGGEWLGPLLGFSRVVVDGGRPVAMVIVNRAPGDAPIGGLWLSEICRAPDATYSGLGTELLRSVISECREAGETALSLAVTDGNPARRLYERLGFVPAMSITKVAVHD